MGSKSSHETYLSINSDSKDDSDIKDYCKYSAKFENGPFAEGTFRHAFKGVLSGRGPRHGHICVTKVFKSEYAKNFIQWAPDIAASKQAFLLAEEFKRSNANRIQNYIQEFDIEFLIPLVAKMKNISRFKLLWLFPTPSDETYVKANEYVALEPFIPGNYDKFNSNGGYEGTVHQLITAFSHWTWCATRCKTIVCDLQGVKSGNKYILTDPAIHSIDQKYGPTDLGIYGMSLVLGNHQCNQLCRELRLTNPWTDENVTGGQMPTMYTFQVTKQEMLRAKERYDMLRAANNYGN